MGRRGPAPKPTALRLLQGNPGKLAINPAEPQPIKAPDDLQPPPWLIKEAKEVWTRLRPDLPWLSVADIDMLAAYCSNYARWREAENFLEAHGLTFVVREPAKKGEEAGKIKFIQQWPQVAISQKCLLMLCKLGGELGLSPASRTRIHVEPEKPAERTTERMFG